MCATKMTDSLIVRSTLAAMAIALVAACGSTAPTTPAATAPTQSSSNFAPLLPTPPAELGNGLVCGAAADRVLGTSDGLDFRQFTRGAHRPLSPAIQDALKTYVGSTDAATRRRSAGLIVGQCSAYGFYIVTYRECINARPQVTVEQVRACIADRRWTLYTQQ